MDKAKLLKMYETLVRIRSYEEEIAALWHEQEMRSPPHFYSGQEAVATGVASALKKNDLAVGYYRGHGYYLAMGGDPQAFISEMYCKVTGSNQGKGGSMLISYPECGYAGSSAIVAGGIPIATGMAFGLKLKKEKRVVVCFLGDAATEEGVFYESLNFAALKKLPIVYVCENNSYAVTTHISLRQAKPNEISKKAKLFGITTNKIDGNDVLKVYDAAKEAVDNARKGKGPSFIEAKTYRLHEHVGEKFDKETGLRTEEEFEYWSKKDPIKRFERKLRKESVLTTEMIKKTHNKIHREIRKIFEKAKSDPLPSTNDLLENVYAEK